MNAEETMMDEMDDKEARGRGLGMFRGLLIGIPLALIIWAVIIWAVTR